MAKRSVPKRSDVPLTGRDQRLDPVQTMVFALLPFVTIALFGIMQDATIALIVALVGAVTILSLRPSRVW